MSETPGLPGLAPEAETPTRSRRMVVLVGIVAVLAALGIGGYLLLSGGDNAATAASGPRPAPLARSTAGTSVSPSSAPVRTLPPAGSEPTRHDPFKPLYSPAPVPATAVPTAPAAPTAVATSGVPVPGSVPTGVLPSGTGTGGPGIGGSTGQDVVTFISIAKTAKPLTVTLRLDGAVVTGAAGDTLGSMLKVLSIRPDDNAATFQLGEATFDLHVGDFYSN